MLFGVCDFSFQDFPVHKKKISITDVARRAQVSISTVSRVINNLPSVTPENRRKVEEAVLTLKFKPNISAQRLASGTTNAVGLVIPGFPGVFYSFYAVEIIRGVGHACEELELDMVLHISNGTRILNTNNVGGVVFADIIENHRQIESALASATPCMVINNEVKDLDVPFIAIDNRKGGEIAANYLHGLGHRKIAIITGNLGSQPGLFRYEGFCAYLKKQGLSIPQEYVIRGDYSRRCAREGMERLLNLPEKPTAVFICSDEMALEAVSVIMEKRLKVPEDISVIGFDDNPACLYGPVALTTIRQPLFEMASQAVKVLHSHMEDDAFLTVQKILPPELVIRESCQIFRAV